MTRFVLAILVYAGFFMTYGERVGFALSASLFSYAPRQDDGSEGMHSSEQSVAVNPEIAHRTTIEPDLATNHLALAIGYSRVGNFEKAQRELREALRLDNLGFTPDQWKAIKELFQSRGYQFKLGLSAL